MNKFIVTYEKKVRFREEVIAFTKREAMVKAARSCDRRNTKMTASSEILDVTDWDVLDVEEVLPDSRIEHPNI